MASDKVLSTKVRDQSKKSENLQTQNSKLPSKTRLASGGKTQNWRRRRPALTLVELQIAVAISAGITLLIGSIYFAYTRLFANDKVSIHVASENRIAIDEITNQIRESPGVSTNCTICGGQTTSSQTVLILKIWPIDANGETFEPTSSEYDYIVYKLDSTPNDKNLIKQIFPNGVNSNRVQSTKILATDTKTLLFEYDSPLNLSNSANVTVTLTSEAKSFTKTYTVSQSSKSVLRNK